MKVLFITLPRITSIYNGSMYTDLIREFKDNGHDIYIMSPSERKYNKKTSLTTNEGVNLLKIKTGNMTKTNIIEKGLTTLFIDRVFLSKLKKYFSNVKFDLIIYSTPPITFYGVIKYVKRKSKAISYLLLKDIFPQNAVDLEMFKKSSFIYKYFRRKEKKLYGISDYIGCMSPANVNYLLSNNVEIPKDKVEVCPNSVNIKQTNNLTRNELDSCRNKYKIPSEKNIIIYGGNLGKPQGIDFLLECIKKNEERNDSFFIIVGSGTEYKKIVKFITINEIRNSLLIEALPKSEYEKLVSLSDVGLIFLDKRFTIPNFPSRILTYMEAGIPILAATDTNTDLRDIMEMGNFGLWCESGDIQKFFSHIEKLKDKNLRELMGRNGNSFLRDNYASEISYNIILKHFEDSHE